MSEQKMRANSDIIEALKAENRDLYKLAISERVKEFFINHGHLIEAIVWNQYTPYWNDGSPCIFNVHDPDFIIKDNLEAKEFLKLADIDIIENDPDTLPHIAGYKLERKLKQLPNHKILKDMLGFMHFIQEYEDEALALFSDHQKVKCTALDITTEDYNHD